LSRKELTNLIKEKSKNLGFNLVGITTPHKIENNFLDNWIDKGYHATMYWMESRLEERKNIFKYFPEVKSVISLGYNYYTDENNLDNSDFKISNYAWGEDYHLVLKKKLYLLLNIIKDKYPDLKYRVCVDTSPVSEKYWAQKAGLGAIGKHTNLINNKIGSWFFISEILIDEELNYDKAFVNDLCGTCTKCIDACPTDALGEYVLDANKCISYLTIEHRGEINQDVSKKLNDWIYGCDICQQVCPWNMKFSEKTEDEAFSKRELIEKMDNTSWNNLDVTKYRELFRKSAVKRTKFEGLKRNIKLNNK
tara:strand:+ start:514 stop:1434 length:921 start_codon:yes stop_codon:yes gene_type:complete